MSSPKKTVSRILYIILGILFIGYVLFQAKNLLLGPIITIDEPKDGTTITYEVVTVAGQAKNVAYIYLNNKQIYVDNNGHFSEKLIAPTGYSIIELSAKDKFGRMTRKIIRIILNKQSIEQKIEPVEASSTSIIKNDTL